jgi:Holliday junction resolvase
MVNKNYVNGRAYEYRIMHSLRKAGFDIVIRSAGSHSPIDCIGIDTNNKVILFVQAKPKTLSFNKKVEIKHKNIKLNDKYTCKFEVL